MSRRTDSGADLFGTNRRESPRLVAQRPSPELLWISFYPRVWPLPGEVPLLDLARGTLWDGGEKSALEAGDALFPDVVYLPPVREEAREARDHLAAEHLKRGTPLLIQLLPGEAEPRLEDPLRAGATLVYDLLSTLWQGDLASLSQLPRGAVAVWPLIAGISDMPRESDAADSSRLELLEEACRRMAEAGVRAVRPLTPRLDAQHSRRLAEGKGEAVFHALFHGEPGVERDVARLLHRHGLVPFLDRPLPRPYPLDAPLSGAFRTLLRNRRLAGRLLLMADILLALDDSAAAAGDPAETSFSLESSESSSGLGFSLSLPDFALAGTGGFEDGGKDSAPAFKIEIRESAAVGRALELIRAAHWLDGTSYDIAALVRERNLRLIPEVDAEARTFIEKALEEGEDTVPPQLEALIEEYLEGGGEPGR